MESYHGDQVVRQLVELWNGQYRRCNWAVPSRHALIRIVGRRRSLSGGGIMEKAVGGSMRRLLHS